MKIVSLFAGAGGLDLGLMQAGHTVVWANDIDPDCEITYRHNIGDHFHLGDIKAINPETIPDCDVIVGGFPCQGFSKANMRRFADDERNSLYLEFCRVLAKKRPRYFIGENVRGILSLDKGNAIKQILKDFAYVGYKVRYQVFNLADFGVPQLRIRVVLIGVREDIPEEFWPQFPTPTHSDEINSNSPRVTISEALSTIPEPDDPLNTFPNKEYSKYKVTNRDFTGHRMTNPDKPSPTILARGNGKGGVVVIQHPQNHRRMTVREVATIQTFPYDFEFFGSLNSKYRQIGNAVPALFARKLGEELAKVEEARELQCV